MTRIVVTAAGFLPVAALSQVLPHGDVVSQLGFVGVLVLLCREFLRNQRETLRQQADVNEAHKREVAELLEFSREAIEAAKRTCSDCGERLQQPRTAEPRMNANERQG